MTTTSQHWSASGDVHHRAHQLRLFLDAYDLSPEHRIGFVDKMVEVAVRDAAHEAVDHQVTPATTSGVSANGYPYAWGIAWRVRSAAWMLRNRQLLDSAIADAPTRIGESRDPD